MISIPGRFLSATPDNIIPGSGGNPHAWVSLRNIIIVKYYRGLGTCYNFEI
jgi:hypothetical protein